MGARFARQIEEDVLLSFAYMSLEARVQLKVRLTIIGWTGAHEEELHFNLDYALYALVMKLQCLSYDEEMEFNYTLNIDDYSEIAQDDLYRFLIFAYLYYVYYIPTQIHTLYMFKDRFLKKMPANALHNFYNEMKDSEAFFEKNWDSIGMKEKESNFNVGMMKSLFQLAYKVMWAQHLNKKYFVVVLDKFIFEKTEKGFVEAVRRMKYLVYDEKYLQFLPYTVTRCPPAGDTAFSYYFIRMVDYIMKKAILPAEDYCTQLEFFFSGVNMRFQPKQERVIKRLVSPLSVIETAASERHIRLMSILIE